MLPFLLLLPVLLVIVVTLLLLLCFVVAVAVGVLLPLLFPLLLLLLLPLQPPAIVAGWSADAWCRAVFDRARLLQSSVRAADAHALAILICWLSGSSRDLHSLVLDPPHKPTSQTYPINRLPPKSDFPIIE